MNYFFLIPLGIIPSILWLFYYLHKDPHPEPRRLIIKIFIWGMAIVPLAALLEIAPVKIFSPTPVLFLLYGAFIEEYLKFWIVKKKMSKDSEMDEPTDAMIYMIVAGLGFAALENIFYLQKLSLELSYQSFSQEAIFQLAFLRFITATFLHALASGLVGYFWALSLFKPHTKIFRAGVISVGIILATLFHAVYNYLTLTEIFILIPVLLYILAVFVTIGFRKLLLITSFN